MTLAYRRTECEEQQRREIRPSNRGVTSAGCESKSGTEVEDELFGEGTVFRAGKKIRKKKKYYKYQITFEYAGDTSAWERYGCPVVVSLKTTFFQRGSLWSTAVLIGGGNSV